MVVHVKRSGAQEDPSIYQIIYDLTVQDIACPE
jgi:hypothetical protein